MTRDRKFRWARSSGQNGRVLSPLARHCNCACEFTYSYGRNATIRRSLLRAAVEPSRDARSLRAMNS